MNASQLGSCDYFVGSCGPTHPSHPMASSTTSALRYGPFTFWLISNCQQSICVQCVHVHSICAHAHLFLEGGKTLCTGTCPEEVILKLRPTDSCTARACVHVHEQIENHNSLGRDGSQAYMLKQSPNAHDMSKLLPHVHEERLGNIFREL